MKRLLFALLLLGLIPSVKSSVLYIANAGSMRIELRCQDGKPDHQILFIDVTSKTKRLELKGQGNRYFRYPELIPTNIYKSENGYLCSQRQMNIKESDSYLKKALEACSKKNKDKGCKGWD
tara:strand:+ start:8401 stop:8763 length:363 start_codon:yes stop_codon:yes gene_type:complete